VASVVKNDCGIVGSEGRNAVHTIVS
jgi:hypothetical protein